MLNYDQTGQSPDNLVFNEIHTLNTSVAIWPVEGVFFIDGLYVVGQDINTGLPVPLKHLTDYSLSPNFLSVSNEIGIEVFTYIVILDSTKWTNITITYQGLGDRTDTTLSNEIITYGAFDEMDPKIWLTFNGEHIVSLSDGTLNTDLTGRFLSILDNRIDETINELNTENQNLNYRLIRKNTDDNLSQNILIDSLILADLDHESEITFLISNIGLNIGIPPTLLVIENAQRNVITGSLNSLTLSQGAIDTNVLKEGAQDLLITANTLTVTVQNTAIAALGTKATDFNATVLADISAALGTISTLDSDLDGMTNRLSIISSKEATQDSNISDNTTEIGLISSRVATITGLLIAEDALIAPNTSKLAVNDTAITALETHDDTQDTTILENSGKVSALQSGGNQTLADAINASTINTNNNVVQDTLIAANTAKDVQQGTRMTAIKSTLTTLEGDVVDLTAQTIAVSSNATEIAALQTTVDSNSSTNATQDIQLATAQTNIDDFITNNTGTDIGPITTEIAANAAALDGMVATADNSKVVTNAHNGKIAILQNQLNNLENGAIIDFTSLINAAYAVKNSAIAQQISVDINTAKQITQNAALDTLDTTYAGLLAVVQPDTSGLVTQSNTNITDLDALIVTADAQVVTDDAQDVTLTGTGGQLPTINSIISAAGAGGTDLTPFFDRAHDNTADIDAGSALVQTMNGISSGNSSQDSNINNYATIDTAQDLRITELQECIALMNNLIPPSMVSPEGIINTDTPLLESTTFAGIVGDTHSSSGWQVSISPDFSTLLIEVINDTSNLTSYLVPIDLIPGMTYYARTRHTGTASGTTEWGAPIQFTISTAVGTLYVESSPSIASGYTGAYAGYGKGLALSNDGLMLVVGEYQYTISNDEGAVYTYDWNGSTWVLRGALLMADTPVGRGEFGWDAALSGNGLILAVGSGYRNYGQGAVYVYDWNAGSGLWIERSHVVEGSNTAYSINSGFGNSVALSDNGLIMAVGAYKSGTTFNQAGEVYTYDWNAGTGLWVERSHLLQASDIETSDFFGSGVALSNNGLILVVGAMYSTEPSNIEGKVYTYDWNGSIWVERNFMLTHAGSHNSGQVGRSVELNGDGTILAVGAPGFDLVFVYDWYVGVSEWVWRGQDIGTGTVDADNRVGEGIAMSDNGDTLVFSDVRSNGTEGRVYTFKK